MAKQQIWRKNESDFSDAKKEKIERILPVACYSIWHPQNTATTALRNEKKKTNENEKVYEKKIE